MQGGERLAASKALGLGQWKVPLSQKLDEGAAKAVGIWSFLYGSEAFRKASILHDTECQRWRLCRDAMGCFVKAGSDSSSLSFPAVSGGGKGDDTILQGYPGKN